MLTRVAALTWQGPRKGDNQDRVVINNAILGSRHPGVFLADLPPESLVAVLDGMGGHADGGVAASLAADTVASGSANLREEQNVVDLVAKANSRLYATMRRSPSLRGMGTTIAGIAITPKAFIVFNVGDSRVYFHAGEYLLRASKDDTAPTGWLTQSLGGGGAFEPVTVHITSEPIGNGRILIASDGLFALANPHDLERAMNGPLETIPDKLSDVAIDSGNDDDIAFAVVDVQKTTF